MKRFTNNANKKNLIALKKKTFTDAAKKQSPLPDSALTASTDDPTIDNLGGDADVEIGGTFEEYRFDNESEQSDEMRYYPMEEEKRNLLGSRGDSSSPKSTGGTASCQFSLNTTAVKDGQLRRRGPLDPRLTKGKYSATPIDVEAAMEDIFGALDMADLDAENEELYERPDEGFDKSMVNETGEKDSGQDNSLPKRVKKDELRKRKRVKDLTEDEYIQWLSHKKKSRIHHIGHAHFSSPDQYVVSELELDQGEEGVILEQLESLRQNQIGLVNANSASHKGTEDESAQHRNYLSQSVRHLSLLYSQFLHLTMKLHSAVSKAVGLPQYYARPLFLNDIPEVADKDIQQQCSTEGKSRFKEITQRDTQTIESHRETIRQTYTNVCRELRTIVVWLFRMTTDNLTSTRNEDVPDSQNAEAFSLLKLRKRHKDILNRAADCISFWGDRFVQSNNTKLNVISQPLMKQIESILTLKHRLRLRVQKNRAHLGVLGHPEHFRAALNPSEATRSEDVNMIVEAKAKRAMSMAGGDVDEEIYEDSDFLREMLRHGGLTTPQPDQRLFDLKEGQNLTVKAPKKRFHRLTKGKTVNYEPRPKLVGFLMAKGFENSGRNDVVLKSLFQ